MVGHAPDEFGNKPDDHEQDDYPSQDRERAPGVPPVVDERGGPGAEEAQKQEVGLGGVQTPGHRLGTLMAKGSQIVTTLLQAQPATLQQLNALAA